MTSNYPRSYTVFRNIARLSFRPGGALLNFSKDQSMIMGIQKRAFLRTSCRTVQLRSLSLGAARSTIFVSMLLSSTMALADGQVRFDVVSAKTGVAIPGAVIRIEPGASEVDELQFISGTSGSTTTGDLVSGERSFTVTAIVNGLVYKLLKGKVTVVDNDVVSVKVTLIEQGFKTIEVNDKVVLINLTDPSVRTFRDKRLLSATALGVGNSQSLSKVLRSVPGFALDPLGGVIARGESGVPQFYVDGFQLPLRMIGSGGQWLDLSFVETLTARTGGHAASYGGASGSVIDLSLPPVISPVGSARRAPETNFRLSNGGFGTYESLISVSQQRAKLLTSRTDLGFTLGVSNRSTSNGSLSPQPGGTAPNAGALSSNVFGRVELRVNASTEFASTFALGSANTGIGNRTGLGSGFGDLGFGFGGQQSTGLSQNDVGLDVTQRDNSELFITQIRKGQAGGRMAVVSLGVSKQTQSVTNGNVPIAQALLPADGPVEYLPSVYQNSRTVGLQADFTLPQGRQITKYGLIVNSLNGGESNAIVPQSAAALAALSALPNGFGARFKPDATGRVPVIYANRKSSYLAGYYQVGSASGSVRWNAGLRAESLDQTNFFALNQPYFDGSTSDSIGNPVQRGARTSSKISPRFNALYVMPKSGTFRLLGLRLFGIGSSQPSGIRFSYNQLFSPVVDQGGLGIGQSATGDGAYPTKAQSTEQYDLSIERQLGSQTVKLGTYVKINNDAIGYQQIVPGVQALGFTTTSVGKRRADGVELTYTLNPRLDSAPAGNISNISGTTGFLTLSNQKSRIEDAIVGVYSPEYDQRTSVVAGLSMAFMGGNRLGLSYAYGSGYTASQFQGSSRAALNEVNARLSFGKKWFGVASLDLSAENMFNANSLVSYGSAFAGTRFQQGRRVFLTLSGKY